VFIAGWKQHGAISEKCSILLDVAGDDAAACSQPFQQHVRATLNV
jgi:hypothetical protein